jgi:serine/threonine-protein kinase
MDIKFTGQSGKVWRYWPNQQLGRPGGFGCVYLGETADGDAMAVKVVAKDRLPGVLDDRLLRREVEIGRRVVDGGGDLLMPVVDVAETEEKLLLVMDRAEGGALAEQSLPLEGDVVIAVMTDIAAGLQQLHSIGILHRDLKPANVLCHEGRWKLADFGIARDEEIGTQNPTFAGWGSPQYMAPELWEAKSPSVKTDLYALGCLGFELLAGHTPYTGDSPALRTAHLTADLPEVPTANVALRNLVARLLAKNPGERPQDARAVLERLQRASVPRTPIQESLARGIGEHDAERSQEASRRTAREAAEEGRRQQIRQARADLEEILADALEDLQQVEPLARLELPRPLGRGTFASGMSSITLSTPDASLRIDFWEQGGYGAIPGDTMVLACAVVIRGRRYDTDLNAANLVYEETGDRLGWQVYRFRFTAIGPPDRYSYGPYGRTHGLRHQDFFGQAGRYYMIHSAMHVWQKDVVPLTVQTSLELFREALDLRPPDPRTGIWPSR